ncbi:MAG TPA: heavy-metal-associated domain-containing protein [Kiritimatiellia bacterium]|nr:heavy-metal-associated domain-containing protein [Kiritimatiellia bacterium]
MRFVNRMGLLLLLVLACAMMTGCFRPNIIKMEAQVPQMKTMECSKIIQDALGRIDGIVSADPDIANHTMTIRFDSRKINIKNVEFLIAGLGFDVNNEAGKPEAKAALPVDCR